MSTASSKRTNFTEGLLPKLNFSASGMTNFLDDENELVNNTQLLEAERLAQRILEETPVKLSPKSASAMPPLNDTDNNVSQTPLRLGSSFSLDNRSHYHYQQQNTEGEGAETSRKRRRENIQTQENEEEGREAWHRNVIRKLEDEKKKISLEQDLHNKTNRELYSLFNDLQGISTDFNLTFEAPELVVVGMQSDGKSSFIEGLLGFQFNIVDTNIGTRRPLIIQMINNPEREQPYCRFRKEHTLSHDEDPFEPISTPIDSLCDEIIRRTNAKAGTDKDQVSEIPIILRVEYKDCANLTIYDTPGFRLGGNEVLRRNIEEMVLRIMKPKHRIIICLEQSTVEWANSVSRPLVRQVDPEFSRTILVNTKFDNRVKEFRDAESTNKYLQGENLPSGKKPFFISMPVKRNLTPQHFADAMKECYLADYRHLLHVHFDEERFGSQIGIFKLKSYLEKVLQQKYIESVSPTLEVLENLCISTQQELNAVKRELKESDIENQKNKVYFFVLSFSQVIEKLLEGSAIGEPDKFGQTLKEEKHQSGTNEWPNFDIKYEIQNSDYKVYGGAQYERLLNEFEYVAHSIEFPKTSINEVASALGINKTHNLPLLETAATDIVQIKVKKTLQPLIVHVLKRCTFIMKRLFDIAVHVLTKEEYHTAAPIFGIIGHYELFQKELRTVYHEFIDKIQRECEQKVLDDFATFTKVLNWDLMMGTNEIKEYDYLNCTKETTKQRVEMIMNAKQTMMMNIAGFDENSRSREMNQSTYQRVLMMAGKLFASVRYFFTKHIRNKLNAFFLDPMFQKLNSHLMEYFRKMTNEQYEQMFNLELAHLQQRAEQLENQLQKFTKSRDQFKQIYTKIKQSTKVTTED